MTEWRVARCIEVLRSEVNTSYPDRPKGGDGTIGDTAHAARVSDHNPNHQGVVTAWDITTAPWSDDLAEHLRAIGRSGDGRVKYVIWNRRICSSELDWAWRVYNGLDPHTGHIHLSVSGDPKQYDRTDPWDVFPIQEDDVTPEQNKMITETRKIAAANGVLLGKLLAAQGTGKDEILAELADLPDDVVAEISRRLS